MESKQEVPTEEDLAGMELATNMLNVSLYLLNENATLAAFGSADRYHHSDTSTSISSGRQPFSLTQLPSEAALW